MQRKRLEHLLHFQCKGKFCFRRPSSVTPHLPVHRAAPLLLHTPPVIYSCIPCFQGPDSFLGTRTVAGVSTFVKELSVYDEAGANAELGTVGFICGRNNYNFLENYRGEFLNSKINASFLCTTAQNSQSFRSFIIKPVSWKRVDII